MGDTLLDDDDDDVPPTQSEPLAPASAAGPPAPAAPGPRPLHIALAIVAALLVVGGVAFYLFVWRYEPLARRHIPGNANVVVRLELADVALFGPVRQRLGPFLEGPDAADPAAPKGKTRADRLHDATGIALATDLREAILATVDGGAWVAVVGGKIPRGRFVKGLAQIAAAESWPGGWHLAGDLLVGQSGFAFGQADDGTLVIGTSVDVVQAALPASDDFHRLALPEDAPVTFALTHEAWGGAAGATVVAHASVLRRIERASGRFTLGKAPELRMEIIPAEGADPAALAGELEQLLAELRIVALVAPDTFGEKGALQAAKVSAKPDRVLLVAPWSYDAIDQGIARIAALLPAASPVVGH